MADIGLNDAEHVLQDIVGTAEISAAIQTVIEGKRAVRLQAWGKSAGSRCAVEYALKQT